MNPFLKLILATLLITSCNSSTEDQQEVQKLDPNEIRMNEIVHDELTDEQLAQIKKIHSTFQELDNSSLEQTITDFKRDVNPDNEIAIWLTMAEAYQNYLKSVNDTIDLNTKIEVYRLILSRSMMPDDEAIKNSTLTLLTKAEAKKVLKFYKAKPDPIDVVK
jgi:hypothetical protein